MEKYNSYDHRLKLLIIESRDLKKFDRFNIPKSTMKTWIANGFPKRFITLDVFEKSKKELCLQIIELENEIDRLKAEANLLISSKQIFNIRLERARFPISETKEKIITVIKENINLVPIRRSAELLGLTFSRLKSWINKLKKCELEDKSSCPKHFPSKASKSEIREMEKLIKSNKYSHFTITALAKYALKTDQVFLSSSSWFKYIKENNWKRNKIRKYKMKVNHQSHTS